MMRDNIKLNVIWYDEVEDFFEIEIVAQNRYVRVVQSAYLSNENVKDIVNDLAVYLEKLNNEQFIMVGELVGNTPPGFSMMLLPAKKDGKVEIEMDMEIADSPTRSHRCKFYVPTTLYHLEQFTKKLPQLCKKYDFTEISLH